jgi:hypothetical protein
MYVYWKCIYKDLCIENALIKIYRLKMYNKVILNVFLQLHSFHALQAHPQWVPDLQVTVYASKPGKNAPKEHKM